MAITNRGNKLTNQLIEFANSLGFQAERTRKHLKFTAAGCAPIFTSATFSDQRGVYNAKADLKRSLSNKK